MGLLQSRSNEQIEADEATDRQRQAELQESQNQPVVIGLVSYIKKCWSAAYRAKQPVYEIMLDNLRRKKGEYDPERKALIAEDGGSEIYMMLTEEKCSAGESWIEEILLPADDVPYSFQPTSVPELAPDQLEQIKQRVMQEAVSEIQMSGFEPTAEMLMGRAWEISQELESKMIKQSKMNAARADEYIQDKAEESGWEDALRDFIPDLVAYPCGFMKGPIVRKKKELAWGQGGSPVVQWVDSLEYESPSPWDIYPSPTSKQIGDGFLIERMQWTRSDLQSLIGVEGYEQSAIEQVLSEWGQGGMRSWLGLINDTERARLEGRENEHDDPESKVDVLQFWGHVQGLALLEFGMDKKDVPKPFDEYFCEVIQIGSYVIKAELNGTPLGKPPYYKAGFRRKKGSFWETSMIELMKDSQDMVNASARNLANNMAIASGPQVGMDVSQLPAGTTSINKLRPWQIHQFDMSKSPHSSMANQPVWFFQPNALTNELLKVYEHFSNEADNKTGIPKYSYGGDTKGSGALSTASGMSMMMANAAKSIKNVVKNVDRGVIEPSMQSLIEWLMVYKPNHALMTGDIKLYAKGSSALIAKEQRQVRMNEMLQLLLHPSIMAIIGPVGLASYLRKLFQGAEMDVEDIVPSKKELEMLMGQQQQALPPGEGGQPGQAPSPTKGANLAADGSKAGGVDQRLM